MIKLNNHVITPTIFPDGTSQVWKVYTQDGLHPSLVPGPGMLEWQFEHEAELIHLAQAKCLVEGLPTHLWVPYFPYARQDKQVHNERTFALKPFCRMLKSIGFTSITTFDIHSHAANEEYSLGVKNLTADALIRRLAKDYDAILFPDSGACQRYAIVDKTLITATKVREQETGKITDYFITYWPEHLNLDTAKVLVVDDICDGGATFIELGKKLFTTLTIRPDLYVSHGIFSKGLDDLRLYYKHIITTDSLPTKHKELIVYESAPPHRLLQG